MFRDCATSRPEQSVVMDPKLLCWNTARTIKASPSNSRPVIPVQHMAAAPRWRARLFIKAWRGLPANDRQRQTLPCAWRGEGCLKELSSRKSLKVLINSFNCSGMGANLQFRARNHGSWIDQSVTLGSGHPSSSPAHLSLSKEPWKPSEVDA